MTSAACYVWEARLNEKHQKNLLRFGDGLSDQAVSVEVALQWAGQHIKKSCGS